MEAHRLAKYFPILEGEEFDLLVQDIKDHGQLEPIITVEGEILDGVNRYRACQQLGIEPIAVEFARDDPLSYVISLNIRRRHLDESQRAMLGEQLRPEIKKEIKEKGSKKAFEEHHAHGHELENPTDELIGKIVGVGSRTQSRAKRVMEQAPEKVDDIIKGKTSVRTVDSELRTARAEEWAAEHKEKANDKEAKQHPKYVKEYLDVSQKYKDSLKLAIECAKRTKLAPEAIQFINNRHNQIRELMLKLEETE